MTGRQAIRGAWRLAAPLALVAVASTACSSSSTPSAGSSSTPLASPTASSTADSAAVAAVRHAVTVAAATHSFRFVATEVLSGDATHATVVRGSVVRSQGVSYVLTANGHSTQVVRIKGATYVRKVPGAWEHLRTPAPVVDPIGSLLAILNGLDGAGSTPSGTTVVVTGNLSMAAATTAQIPTTPGHPPRVSITIDAAGDITRLVVTTTARGGATAVTLTTTYTAFNTVAPLKPPV
jgi:hypothetical protein